MKIKYLFLAMAMTVATSASAQFVGSGARGNSSGGFGSDSEYAEPKPFTHELDFYIQDGWGIGYQLRKDFNPYVGWNIFGVSYMSGFYSPADFGQVNFKLLGVRGYTPAYRTIRGYVDLNLGYTLSYYDGWDGMETTHNFGLDFSVGVQLFKNFAIGYNLNFLAPDKAKSHWARFAFLF
ncbi:MAG: hypothetical protein IJ148_00870 [Bacteroidaceae bacterium]|nr:hypothetical protein [Bacteroidaceae bacterium]